MSSPPSFGLTRSPTAHQPRESACWAGRSPPSQALSKVPLIPTGNEAEPQHGRFRETTGQELKVRLTFSPRAREQQSPPSNPMSGNELPVFGSCGGVVSAGVAGAGAVFSGAAAGAVAGVSAGGTGTRMMRTGISGGGGISPVRITLFRTTVSGTSVTDVAETFMPGFRENASVGCPSTVNFVPSGIVNC